jgi:LysR family nitrogen assimilation transcriptional regulator
MKLRQIEYFVEIAAAGSLSRAANRLRVAQSALSRQMRLLEDSLGVPILERHGRGIRLTESGHLFHERAKLVLREVNLIREEILARSKVPTGALHIGMPTSMRSLLTLPAVERFLRGYPRVFLKIIENTSAVVRECLLAGEIDIGLLSALETTNGMDITQLMKERMYLVGAVGSGLSLERPVSLSQVAERDLLLPSRPASLRLGLERSLGELGLQPRIMADINSTLLFDLVASGLGYTVFPYWGIHALLLAKKVAASPIDRFEMTWILATSRERPLSLAAQIFRDILVDTARTGIETGLWRSATLSSRLIEPPHR